jgi:hypothetical protein
MKRAWLILAILTPFAAGCHKRATPASSGTPGTSGAPAASGGPASVPAPPGAWLSDHDLIEFCAATLAKTSTCVNDDEFWNILATFAFAGKPIDDATRHQWIGMRKDDILGIARENGFRANCAVMVKRGRPPTAATGQMVTRALNESCAKFAAAQGHMIFIEGAFNRPRD